MLKELDQLLEEPKKETKKTTIAIVYCKRYDGKVFERKEDCGVMKEITYAEYKKGDEQKKPSITIQPFDKPEF